MLNASYSASSILEVLNDSCRRWRFPILDGGEGFPAAVRLTAYRSDDAWAIILEELGFYAAGIGHGGIVDFLYCYGTGIVANDDVELHATSDGPEGPTFDSVYYSRVRPEAKAIRIRGRVTAIPRTRAAFERAGVMVEDPSHILGQDLLRVLVPDHRNQLLAMPEERRECVSPMLALFAEFNEWYHPSVIQNRQRPGDCETFQMLAEALVAGDIGLYRPTYAPNTDWWNWPDDLRI